MHQQCSTPKQKLHETVYEQHIDNVSVVQSTPSRVACNSYGFEHLILHMHLKVRVASFWRLHSIPHGGPLYKASAGVRVEVGFSHSNEAHIYPTSVCASTSHHRHSVRVATFHHTLINRSSAWHIQCMMMHDIDVI